MKEPRSTLLLFQSCPKIWSRQSFLSAKNQTFNIRPRRQKKDSSRWFGWNRIWWWWWWSSRFNYNIDCTRCCTFNVYLVGVRTVNSRMRMRMNQSMQHATCMHSGRACSLFFIRGDSRCWTNHRPSLHYYLDIGYWMRSMQQHRLETDVIMIMSWCHCSLFHDVISAGWTWWYIIQSVVLYSIWDWMLYNDISVIQHSTV